MKYSASEQVLTLKNKTVGQGGLLKKNARL